MEDGLGNNFLVVDKPEGEPVAYLPFNGFTTTELSVEADPGRQIIIAPMEGEAAAASSATLTRPGTPASSLTSPTPSPPSRALRRSRT